MEYLVKKKRLHEPNGSQLPELNPVSVAWSDWEYYYSPLNGMLVHRKVTPQHYVVGTHLYTWVKRDNVEQSFLSKETTLNGRGQVRTTDLQVESPTH